MEKTIDQQMNDLKELSTERENLLDNIVKSLDFLGSFENRENFLILAREWNSWYPSTFEVIGGCYLFNINQQIIIIDPGFNTLEVIRRYELDVRLIRHIIVTHFHPDHCEHLIKLLTQLKGRANNLTVYLNSTSFKQFQIYSRENVDFIELKPGMNVQLNTDK